jgi:hypothetical protein
MDTGDEFIREYDRGTVECLLTCGHWSSPISDCSSRFDFPYESDKCPTCGEERQWDVRLQAARLLQMLGEENY